MTGTVHVRMTGTAGHVVALDVGWQLPTRGWTKVNVDGNCEWMLGHAICGGGLEAELWGVYVGLGCDLDKGLQKVVIEMDCSEVMELLLKNLERLVSMPVLFHIKDLVRQLEDVEFKLIHRSNNKVVDRISCFSCSSDFNVHVLEYPTYDLQDLL
ncbi:hypothetical protein V6N13_034143 [Hibiscus sabdariffa]